MVAGTVMGTITTGTDTIITATGTIITAIGMVIMDTVMAIVMATVTATTPSAVIIINERSASMRNGRRQSADHFFCPASARAIVNRGYRIHPPRCE